MEDKQLFRVVNLGLSGEPIRHGLQNPETLQIIEYSTIKYVVQNGNVREAVIPNDPDSFIQNVNQSGYVSIDSNGNASLYID